MKTKKIVLASMVAAMMVSSAFAAQPAFQTNQGNEGTTTVIHSGTLQGNEPNKHWTNDGTVTLAGNSYVTGDQTVDGNQAVAGNQGVAGDQSVFGDQHVFGNTKVDGKLTVSGVDDVASAIKANQQNIEKNGFKADSALQLAGNGVLNNHAQDLTTGVNLNTQAIEKEAAARTEADTKLQNNIDAEVTDRKDADNKLQSQIDTNKQNIETNKWKAESALQLAGNGVLNNHAQDLTTGVNLNTQAIEKEAAARTEADTKLQGNIDAETTARTEADTKLQGNIDAEAATRADADVKLQTNIDAEATARQDADAKLQTNVANNAAAIQENSSAIQGLRHDLSDLGDEVDNVGAMSAALAGLHPLDYNGTGSKFQISAAVGTYDGTQAAALGGFYHFNQDVMVSLGAATNFSGDRKTAANLGITFRVGKGADKSASVDSDVMERLAAMDQKINELEAQNKNLKSEIAAVQAKDNANA